MCLHYKASKECYFATAGLQDISNNSWLSFKQQAQLIVNHVLPFLLPPHHMFLEFIEQINFFLFLFLPPQIKGIGLISVEPFFTRKMLFDLSLAASRALATTTTTCVQDFDLSLSTPRHLLTGLVRLQMQVHGRYCTVRLQYHPWELLQQQLKKCPTGGIVFGISLFPPILALNNTAMASISQFVVPFPSDMATATATAVVSKRVAGPEDSGFCHS
ncbi:hypothetical protein MMC07_006725 [Pseudocyphellaria aurata]|nr:hypothetical protein [Pseudocyphellaria aurata]